MNNYEYIIASLPVLSPDPKGQEGLDPGELIQEVRSQLSAGDNSLVDTLMEGFDDKALGEEFYRKALSSKNRFLREYFNFDLALRNAKVRYLNQALGREPDQDVFLEAKDVDEIEELPRIETVLSGSDILERERGLDDILWEKIDTLTTFDYFDSEAVLGFLSKLMIVGRWLSLDEGTGRELFKKLVTEVRGTFKGVKYES